MINQLVDMVEKRQVAFSLQSNFEMMAKDKTCKTNAKDTILFVQILWWPCPLAGFSLYMVVFRINKAKKYRKFGFRKYTHRIHAWYSFLDLVDLHWQICTIHGPYEIVICPRSPIPSILTRCFFEIWASQERTIQIGCIQNPSFKKNMCLLQEVV